MGNDSSKHELSISRSLLVKFGQFFTSAVVKLRWCVATKCLQPTQQHPSAPLLTLVLKMNSSGLFIELSYHYFSHIYCILMSSLL